LPLTGKSIHRQNRPQNQLICSDKPVARYFFAAIINVFYCFKLKKQ